MTSAPPLGFPNFEATFVVESNASNIGIEVILTQKGKPIAYFSKSFSIRHQAQSIYEKEMMTIVIVVKKYNNYILGRHFHIKIDHRRCLEWNVVLCLFQTLICSDRFDIRGYKTIF
ncbi:reverse transcriptase [Gossypium australe]|uniref:Reverse transcriptase n=1 Tax=Gossypium australe TaxID=47621 RepID=A0A5B6WQT5_9ROSI|nr:reverse transcriptase [Gossypium australe]